MDAHCFPFGKAHSLSFFKSHSLSFFNTFCLPFRIFNPLCGLDGVENIAVGVNAVFIFFEVLCVEFGNLRLFEEFREDALLQGGGAFHQSRKVLEHVHPFVEHGYELVLLLVELWNLDVDECQFVVEHSLLYDIHEFDFVVKAVLVVLVLVENEVEEPNGVYAVQMIVPFFSPFALFSYGESGVVDSPIFEELLINILHFNDEPVSLLVLAVHVEDGAS